MTEQTNAATLIEYSREISPRIREINKKKELLKDFKESDETALELAEAIKEAQATLKKYLAEEDRPKELQDEIKAQALELKLAIKAASRVSKHKPAELKAFFTARVKEDGVKKVIVKGDKFEALVKELNE